MPAHSHDFRWRYFAALVSRRDRARDRRGPDGLAGERNWKIGNRGKGRISFRLDDKGIGKAPAESCRVLQRHDPRREGSYNGSKSSPQMRESELCCIVRLAWRWQTLSVSPRTAPDCCQGGNRCQGERLTSDRTFLALRTLLKFVPARLRGRTWRRNFATVASTASSEKQYALALSLKVRRHTKARIASGGRR
jgi:hypothetical protein